MSNQHHALYVVRGESPDGHGRTTRWYVDDDILHVSHTNGDGDTTHLHYRLVRIEQRWVDAEDGR